MADACGLEAGCICAFGTIGYLCHKHPRVCARLTGTSVVGLKIASVYFLYNGLQTLVPREIGNACWKQSVRDLAIAPEGYRCEDPTFGDGQPVLLGCWIDVADAPSMSGWGPFANMTTATYGLRTEVSRMQCVELSARNVIYRLGYSTSYVNMSTFLHYEEAVEACGVEQNPPWPTDLPENRMELAHGHTKIGAFTTEMAVTGGVAGADLSEPVVDPDWHASGWAREEKHFTSMAWRVPGRSDRLGDVALSIYRNRYDHRQEKDADGNGRHMVPEVFLLLAGQNQGGKIVPWKSPWPCHVEAKMAAADPHIGERGFTEGQMEFNNQYVDEEDFSYVGFLNHSHLIGWGKKRSGELNERRVVPCCYIWFAVWLAFLCSKDINYMSSYFVSDMASYVFDLANDENCFRPCINAFAPAALASVIFLGLLLLGLHLAALIPPVGYAVLGIWVLLLVVIFVVLLRASVACWIAIIGNPYWEDALPREVLLKDSRNGEPERCEGSEEATLP
mmetsp:Transcript_21086/g.48380  ORF Transcript_21086/g.48380 Transcript_21086/m.48380 type:complete len:505 (-) Transcript_21086:131-1645(-)